MNYKIFLEWDSECGIFFSKMYPLREGIEEAFLKKEYGDTIKEIGVVLICRNHEFKQRKRFKKSLRRLEYDIILDYSIIKLADMEGKKSIIRKQIVEITELIFSSYKFENFDKIAFLTDFKSIVNSVEW